MDLDLQVPGILMVRASILFSAHTRCHTPACRASPLSLLLTYRFLRHFWARSEMFTPFQPVHGGLNLNSPPHECQHWRDKPRGWFSIDKCTVPSPGKLLCQEKGIMIFERLNYTSLQKNQKANVLNPILRNPSPPFLLHNVSHMSLPSHIHSSPSGRLGWERHRLTALKQNSWASVKAWKWLCSCPGVGDLLLAPLVPLMGTEIKRVGSSWSELPGRDPAGWLWHKREELVCAWVQCPKNAQQRLFQVLLTVESK